MSLMNSRANNVFDFAPPIAQKRRMEQMVSAMHYRGGAVEYWRRHGEPVRGRSAGPACLCDAVELFFHVQGFDYGD